MLRRVLFLLVLLVLPLVVPTSPAKAQYDAPIVEYVDRFLLHENPDGSWDVFFSLYIPFQPDQTAATALLPLPADIIGELETETAYSLLQLQAATEPQPIEPANPCSDLFPILAHANFGPPYAAIWESELTTYTVLAADESNNIDRLSAEGYQMSEEQQRLAANFLADGMSLLAVQLSPQADATFEEGAARLDTYSQMIHFTVAARPNLEPRLLHADGPHRLITWVIANEGYSADNYPVATPDFSTFLTASEAQNIGTGWPTGINGAYQQFQDQYRVQIGRLRSQSDGAIIIPQLRLPLSSGLDSTRSVSFRVINADELPMIGDLLTGEGIITRLYMEFEDGTLSAPITLSPEPAVEWIDSSVQLGDYVLPVDYYGCHTVRESRVTYDVATIQRYRDDWSGLTVVVPQGWVATQTIFVPNLSAIEADFAFSYDYYLESFDSIADWPITIWADSADAISLDTVRAYIRGESTPSMLVTVGFQGYMDPYGYAPINALALMLGMSTEDVPNDGRQWGRIIYPPAPSGDRSVLGHGLLVMALLPPDMPARDRGFFSTLLDMSRAHLFYASLDFQHALFLNEDGYYQVGDDVSLPSPFRTLLQIPFAEGNALLAGDMVGEIVIATADGTGTARIIPLDNFLIAPDESIDILDAAVWQPLTDYLATLGATIDPIAVLNTMLNETRLMEPLPIHNAQDGSVGWVVITPHHLIIFSTTDDGQLERLASWANAVRVAFAS